MEYSGSGSGSIVSQKGQGSHIHGLLLINIGLLQSCIISVELELGILIRAKT